MNPPSPAPQKHALTGAVTIDAVSTLHRQLRAWVAELPPGGPAAILEDPPLTVDAGGIEEVDGAGLQLLVALSKTLAAHGRPLHLVAPSASLIGACDALGVAELLLDSAARARIV